MAGPGWDTVGEVGVGSLFTLPAVLKTSLPLIDGKSLWRPSVRSHKPGDFANGVPSFDEVVQPAMVRFRHVADFRSIGLAAKSKR